MKNLKQQERMTMAKLDAHRCLVRDTVVAVPPPETLIAQFVHPSHVVVQRCTGRTLLNLVAPERVVSFGHSHCLQTDSIGNSIERQKDCVKKDCTKIRLLCTCKKLLTMLN